MTLSRWAAPVVTLALFGCNTGNVQISDQAPGLSNSGTAQTAPGVSTNGSTSSNPPHQSTGQGSTQGDAAPGPGKVYFERVLMDGGYPDQTTAISFASEDSTTTTPFGVPLKSAMNFSRSPVFFPFGDQLIYLSANGLASSGLGSDSLASTALETMETHSLFDFPGEVAALAVDSSQTLVAWIDSSGSTWLSSLLAGTTQALSIPGDRAISVQITGNNLLVLTAGGQAVVFPAPPAAQAQPEFEATGILTAVLSPDGSQLAYVDSAGSLYVAKLSGASAGGANSPLLTLSSTDIHDFSWPVPGRVSYWVRLSSGASEIHVVELSSPREIAVAQLGVPASVANGIVCPAWAGNALYFGDVSGGEFVIERAIFDPAAKTAKLAAPMVFAAPPANDEGFVCPKAGVAK